MVNSNWNIKWYFLVQITIQYTDCYLYSNLSIKSHSKCNSEWCTSLTGRWTVYVHLYCGLRTFNVDPHSSKLSPSSVTGYLSLCQMLMKAPWLLLADSGSTQRPRLRVTLLLRWNLAKQRRPKEFYIYSFIMFHLVHFPRLGPWSNVHFKINVIVLKNKQILKIFSLSKIMFYIYFVLFVTSHKTSHKGQFLWNWELYLLWKLNK